MKATKRNWPKKMGVHRHHAFCCCTRRQCLLSNGHWHFISRVLCPDEGKEKQVKKRNWPKERGVHHPFAFWCCKVAVCFKMDACTSSPESSVMAKEKRVKWKRGNGRSPSLTSPFAAGKVVALSAMERLHLNSPVLCFGESKESKVKESGDRKRSPPQAISFVAPKVVALSVMKPPHFTSPVLCCWRKRK